MVAPSAPMAGSPASVRVPPWRSIRFRIVAAFLASLLATLGAQAWLVSRQQQITVSMTLITKGYLPLAKVVERLGHDRERVDTDVNRLLRGEMRPSTGSDAATRLYSAEMQRTLEEGRIHVAFARHVTTVPEEQATLNKIDTQLDGIGTMFDGWQRNADAFVALAEAGESDEAAALREPLLRDGTRLGDEIDTLGRLVDDHVDALTTATERAQARATAIAVGLTVLAGGIGSGLIIAVLVALRPIGELTAGVQRLAAGERGGRVEVRGADEIAILAAEFNQMVAALQQRDDVLVERAHELDRLSRYLASVLDALEDGLVVVEDGRVTLANPAAASRWGARVGATVPAPIDRPPGSHAVAIDAALHEVRVMRFGDSGRVVVDADVTEQTRTRDRLARSERLALIGQMLAQITHEVRNPLNALSLNAELLQDELAGLDPDKRTEAWDLLATVANEIERLTAVTGHYLQLARRPRAQLAAEDVGGLVDDVARLLAAELAQAGVALTVHADALPPQLVDGNQLKQALLNIVRNAVEAGAKRLTLELRAADGEIALSLTDDGGGMTPDEVARVGEPFWSNKPTGTGLGLAITRQILEDHDGAVRVVSTPGEGTTVTLALPARDHRPAA
jgi:signal transduction histidine kinase